MKPALTIALVTSILIGSAGSATAGINGREQSQRARIQNGVRSGELTRAETARLAAEQAAVRAQEYAYRHDDGVIGPHERHQLNRHLNRTNRDIYRQKHDSQDRW